MLNRKKGGGKATHIKPLWLTKVEGFSYRTELWRVGASGTPKIEASKKPPWKSNSKDKQEKKEAGIAVALDPS